MSGDLFAHFTPHVICGVFTNAALAAIFTTLSIFVLCCTPITIIPGYLQIGLEMIYNFIKDQLGPKHERYIVLMFTLFLYICVANLLSMMPIVFPVTSHFFANLAFSLPVFLVMIYEGFVRNFSTYINHFLIPGVPNAISPMVALIELFSFCLRPITLALRLCITITIGHLLLNIFSSIAAQFGDLGVLGLPVLILITLIEFFIAILQAGIFTLLCCIYIAEIK